MRNFPAQHVWLPESSSRTSEPYEVLLAAACLTETQRSVGGRKPMVYKWLGITQHLLPVFGTVERVSFVIRFKNRLSQYQPRLSPHQLAWYYDINWNQRFQKPTIDIIISAIAPVCTERNIWAFKSDEHTWAQFSTFNSSSLKVAWKH